MKQYIKLLFFLFLSAAIAATFFNYNTSFHIVADTESATIKLVPGQEVEFFGDRLFCEIGEVEFFLHGKSAITIKSTNNVEIGLDNSVKNKIIVRVSCKGDSCGVIETYEEESGINNITRLGKDNKLTFNIFQKNQEEIHSITWPIEGALKIGQVPVVSYGFAPMLIKGRVDVRSQSLFSKDLTVFSSVNLDLGDEVEIGGASALNVPWFVQKMGLRQNVYSGKGFIRIEKDKTMKFVVDVYSDFVKINRYRATGYVVRLSIVDKFKKDLTVQALWSAIGIIILFYGFYRKNTIDENN